MNKEDSIDIDDRIDFEIAIALATKKTKTGTANKKKLSIVLLKNLAR